MYRQQYQDWNHDSNPHDVQSQLYSNRDDRIFGTREDAFNNRQKLNINQSFGISKRISGFVYDINKRFGRKDYSHLPSVEAQRKAANRDKLLRLVRSLFIDRTNYQINIPQLMEKINSVLRQLHEENFLQIYEELKNLKQNILEVV